MADRGRRRWPFVAAALAGVVAVAGALVPTPGAPSAPAAPADAPVEIDAPVARAPSEVPVVPREPVDLVDVVCSDLRRLAVPVDLLPGSEPGTVVELAQGPCVVMGTEGATIP